MIRPTNPNAMKLFLFRYREKLPGNVGSFAKAHPERVKHFVGTDSSVRFTPALVVLGW